MFIVKKNTRITTAILATVAFGIAAILGWTYLTQQTSAADMSKFDPGNIMSDAVMSNKDSMSVQQIQAFLNSKNACNNTNTYMASWYPHLQYTIRDGKFVCMAQDTFNGKSAAQIIWQVGQDYNINPQFLIVLLEKEQGLVTDTWPNHVQYRSATGFGCPDTAACDSKYFGLENQLVNAANLFRTVLNGGWSNYPVGWTYVQYNPNASCGGKVINIQNRATSALYRYTPYQPNQSALNAGYGLGDPCGAYGNRNTWALFSDWFGDPANNGMIPLDDPRWMEVNTTTKKVDVYTKKEVGPSIAPGSQAKFIDKIFINGEWFARTQWDKDNNNLHGFRTEQLSDIKFESIPETWMVTNTDTSKQDFLRDRRIESTPSRSLAKFVDRATVNGKTYLRTEYERNNGQSRGYLSSEVGIFQLFDFQQPRFMASNENLTIIDAITKESKGTIPKGSVSYYSKLIVINGTIYAQPVSEHGTNNVVSSVGLVETSQNPYYSFIDPRMMKTTVATQKIDMKTSRKFGNITPSESHLMFIDQIKVNGNWYARTLEDKQSGNSYGYLVSELDEINSVSISKITRTIKNNTKKADPLRNITYEQVSTGASADFVKKITVSGRDYYLTKWESDQGRSRYIPAEDINL